MPKIVIADPMENEVVEALRALGKVEYQPKDLPAALHDADALIVRSATQVTSTVLAQSPKLRIVARAGVGLDNVDVAACAKRNIKVLNTPGASANAVAELAIASMFNLLRRIPRAHLLMKNKIWAKKELVGEELEGKTLGIIGFGRIGRLVAYKALALGVRVVAYDPSPNPMEGVQLTTLEEVLAESDLLSLHTVLTKQTKNMIDADAIAKMKKGAYLINIARGELIDEYALYDACKSGKIAGAALDVYASEPYAGKLLELDNVYFTPHIGASTKEAQLRIGNELVERLKAEWASA